MAPRSLRRAALAAALAFLLVPASPAAALDDGLARTPPMGWNGWYRFGCGVTERIAQSAADSLVASGMRRAGYRYLNLDDCWMAYARRRGQLVPDRLKFPHGIAPLARRLHARGLRLGVYLSAGRMTCAGRPGSAGHLEGDVADLARWGVDYLKVDWCHAQGLTPAAIYSELRDAVREAGRPMVLSISTWGTGDPWLWGPDAGHLWRIDHDLTHVAPGNMWRSVVTVAAAAARLGAYSRPGAWNDPDVLPLGWGGLTPNEERTTLSLWSVIAAPLLAGADVRRLSRATRTTYLNTEVIAVDQDPAGVPGSLVQSTNGLDVWVRPLTDGSRALLLVNRNAHAVRFRLDAAQVTGLRRGRLRLRDLWTHRTVVGPGPIERRVAPHGVAMLRVSY